MQIKTGDVYSNTFQTICYFCIALLVNYYVEINGSEASIECVIACGVNSLRSVGRGVLRRTNS